MISLTFHLSRILFSRLRFVNHNLPKTILVYIRSDKPDLQPASWRPKSLESKFEVELTGRIPKSLFSLTFVDRSGDTVNNVLEQVVDPVAFQPGGEGTILPARPDFIIMGHHGRKGPKERKASIGSTADRALRYANVNRFLLILSQHG